MKRSDRLAENALVRELTTLERNLQEFAGRQPTSGRSGVTSYLTETADTWDEIITVGSDADSMTIVPVVIEVTYTSDGSQEFPIENVFADLRVNGTAEANRPELDADGVFRWSDGTRTVTVESWAERDQSYLDSSTQYKWTFFFNCFKHVTLYFKAQASGTSGGSLSVVRTL